MKNILKLGLAAFGFALATFANTNSVTANPSSDLKSSDPIMVCYGSGTCGVSSGGVTITGTCGEC